MKRTATIAFTLLMVLPVAAVAADGQSKVLANCKRDWPADYSMQEYCVRRQVRAMDEVEPYLDRAQNDKAVGEVFDRCATQWADGDTFDFAMVVYCLKRQLEAKDVIDRLQ